ncbi:MAG TPA: lysophospholipid acyltransferase family protein [Blastocatellia bacterium]|nr:lysophospholipid acyltransferase family protein [Blastocatellia bacterium]
MAYARLIVRAIALSVLTVAVYAVLRFGLAVTRRSSRRSARWQELILHRWARSAAFVLGLKIDVSCNAPAAPFLLVSNHLSYVDVVVFASQLHCLFVAKKDVESWPIIGTLCRSVGTIFTDRRNRRDLRRVNDGIAQALEDGRGVILFPEGTSTKGSSVLPFRSSLLEAAAKQGFPVSSAAVSYRVLTDDPPASMSVCWWGEMTFGSHFAALLRLRRIEATVSFGSTEIRADDRKVLAERLWFEVNRLFVPVQLDGASPPVAPIDSHRTIGVEEQCNAAMR